MTPDREIVRDTRLTVLDLFSGCGGMSAGFDHHSESFRVVGAVDKQVSRPGNENSPAAPTSCNATYEMNLGVRPLCLDLEQVGALDIMSRIGIQDGDLDVLLACPPCTGFSQKNPRNHNGEDPRNRLVERVSLFAEGLKPRFVVMENVPALAGGVHRDRLKKVVGDLEFLGYEVWWKVVNFSGLGLPQRRHRLVVIASRGVEAPRLDPAGHAETRTVRDAIGKLPPISAGEIHPEDEMHRTPGLTPPVLDRIRAIPHDGGSWSDILDDEMLSDSDKAALLIPSMLNGGRNSFPDVYGRLEWDRPAVTITRECAHVGNGRFVHPEQDRLLSIREMAILQGFPEDYAFAGSVRSRYNQIGDAVPPLIAQQIAALIRGAVEST